MCGQLNRNTYEYCSYLYKPVDLLKAWQLKLTKIMSPNDRNNRVYHYKCCSQQLCSLLFILLFLCNPANIALNVCQLHVTISYPALSMCGGVAWAKVEFSAVSHFSPHKSSFPNQRHGIRSDLLLLVPTAQSMYWYLQTFMCFLATLTMTI